jgi:hypothetical protein
MARSRPCGRSKSDHRVCQAARFARAAEYRERTSISAERQEILIAAVNARRDDLPAPRRRRCQRSKGSKPDGQPAREVPARGRCSAADQKAKRQDARALREAVNCAAERGEFAFSCLEHWVDDLSSTSTSRMAGRAHLSVPDFDQLFLQVRDFKGSFPGTKPEVVGMAGRAFEHEKGARSRSRKCTKKWPVIS